MNDYRLTTWLAILGLLLALGGCGNKGPLELPDDERDERKTRTY